MYLYMHEPTPLWGVKPDVRDEPGTARSPWTGRALPVCTLLHACFVWYGLFFFWGQVMCSSHAPAEEARRGIARASAGFMKGPILDQLGPERIGCIRQEVPSGPGRDAAEHSCGGRVGCFLTRTPSKASTA